MIEIRYGEDKLFLTIPKSLINDKNIRNFLQYIRVKEIVNKSNATDNDIKDLAFLIKEEGKKELLQLLNEK